MQILERYAPSNQYSQRPASWCVSSARRLLISKGNGGNLLPFSHAEIQQ
jgi:hypothetical protein